MLTVFQLQLLASFFLGGGMIALLSFWAERAPSRTAGVILSLPSTVAIGLFFIGWTLGPERMPEVVAPIPFTAGSVFLFVIAYLYLSKLKLPKPASMLLCISASLTIWLAISFPIAISGFNNLGLSLLAFITLGLIGYYFITLKPHTRASQKPLTYTPLQKIARAAFAGSIITIAVYLANTLGPVWGGVFSYFPAVYTSTLLILHWKYNSDFLFKVFKHTPIGSIPTITFAIACAYTFPVFGVVGGILLAYGISLVPFTILMVRPE
ncbi:MAG: DUF3147 family protein [Candidatus Peregrinibacteria bacterium]|nr:DUF3147 family protein [Candidatus Peregrinibacteria bacterium]